MNTKLLVIINSFLALILAISLFPGGGVAVLCAAVAALVTIWAVRAAKEVDTVEKDFLAQIFLLGLIPRIILAAIIFAFQLEPIFGSDAVEYHKSGTEVANQWWSDLGYSPVNQPFGNNASVSVLAGGANNWGMSFFVSILYFLFGPNALLIQLFSVVCGAATAPILYLCAASIFKNKKVARFAALFAALFPAMVIWSSQELKDGFIVFFLVLGILTILRLQKTFSSVNIAILLFVMVGIFTFRFYLFPVLSLAAVGGFLIGSQTSFRDILSRSAVILSVGVVLMFLGVAQQSQTQLEESGNLKRIEVVRRGGNTTAESGFNDEADVSTVSGALSALPLGLTNLLMAPFPWQMQKMTQLMLLPEMLLWWLSLPLTFIGLWYVLKNKLRENIPILIFVIILGLSYALTQGNIGTMYRQRTQIQVFLFLFTAVGIVILLEKREDAKLLRARNRQMGRSRIHSIQS